MESQLVHQLIDLYMLVCTALQEQGFFYTRILYDRGRNVQDCQGVYGPRITLWHKNGSFNSPL